MTASPSGRPLLVHVTTTDMSLDWLLGPQLRAFGQAGYDVVGASAPGPHVAALEEMGVRHVAIPAFTRSTNPLQDVQAFVQLVRTFRRLRPDVVHTHNPKPGILGRIAARLARVPVVVNTQHGLYAQPSDRRRRRWPVYAAERVAAAFSHMELVQNPEDVDTLIDRLRVPRRRVRWLGNGIDTAHFSESSAGARERVRAGWGVGADEVLCGVVARLVREKGIAEILEAAHLLREQGASVRVVIIGPADPDKADAVDPSLVERAVADGVVFAGRRDDMVDCYAAMDLFLTASWREGFPRSAMEAAAMGLATVATDIRGNRQVVADGETGVLVPLRDPEALAEAVASLAGDPDRRASWGRAARARAEVDFDHRRVIELTLDTYRTLLPPPRHPSPSV